MHNQDLGRVAVVARGAYDPAAEYERLDAVSYNGSSYLVRKHCQGVEPAEGEYYMLMAQAGDSTAANAAAVEALAAAGRADTAAGNADQNAAAAGAAADSANKAAAEAKDVVNTVIPDVNKLKKDLVNVKDEIALSEITWLGTKPIIENYSYAGVGSLEGYTLSLQTGQTISGNTRVGIAVRFEDDFVGKKLIFRPKFICTGQIDFMELSVTKQSGFDGLYNVINNDVNHPEILLDFTSATSTNIKSYYLYVIVKGKGLVLSEDSTITYTEEYEIVFDGSLKSKRFETIERTIQRLQDIDSFITDAMTANLINPEEIEHNIYYDGTTGAKLNGSNYLSSTGLIHVEEGSTYTINRYSSSQPQWTCWDDDGNFVEGSKNNGYSYTIPTGKNIKFMRVSILMTEEETAMIVKGSNVDFNNYWPFEKPAKYPKTHWFGKKIATIGDSLTQMEYWQPMLASILGMEYQVISQSGGNMTAISAFVEQLDDDIDVLTVWAGTNDFANDVSVGTFGDTNIDTYARALQNVIEYCSTNRPGMKLLLITPMQRFDAVVSSWEKDNKGNWINPNTRHTLEDFANMVLEYGEAYSIPVLDIYHSGGVNTYNISHFSNDLLHPTRAGFQKICWTIIEKIKSM